MEGSQLKGMEPKKVVRCGFHRLDKRSQESAIISGFLIPCEEVLENIGQHLNCVTLGKLLNPSESQLLPL